MLAYKKLALASLFLLVPAHAEPTVDLGYAKYQGSVDPATNIASFLGIRYAAAPVGPGRFGAPQPPLPVPGAGVLNATTQPAQCWQVESANALSTNPYRRVHAKRAPTSVSDEDCLFLSVYYPSDASGAPPNKTLPVMVWIHGGGYLLGSSSQFRGSDLIRQANNGLVVVVIQYRLGLFGFLAGSQVEEHGALNAGLLDQQFALRWVQSHIAKFGGSPSHVTIFGESAGKSPVLYIAHYRLSNPSYAGGGAVFQQILANGGNTHPPLFKNAISSSPFMPSQYRYDERIPEAVYAEVLRETNCTTFACLRATPTSELQTANLNINLNTFVGTYAFPPVVDGSFIRERPLEALRKGRVNGEMLLVGTNAFEGSIFVNTSIPAAESVGSYALELLPNLRASKRVDVEKVHARTGTEPEKIVALAGDLLYFCSAYSLLRAFRGRAYKLSFAIPPGQHGTDLQYYFPSLVEDVPVLNYPFFFNNTQFINAFAQSFTAFGISGDPNVKISDTITPIWARWKDEDGARVEMVFNRTENSVPWVYSGNTGKDRLERCRFWEELGAVTGH
ncbi:Carboxylic ester hydrolase [Mycena kentingensis (nom. inval.)]|nr:Carboxylic ester hydrolase [Mycena kentingensis (nom. inval.)]